MPRSTPVEVQCQQCGQTFGCRDYRPTRPPKYCGRQCRDLAQTTRVELTCRQCGRTFDRKAYMAEWSQGRGPFCGFDCYGAWQSENTVGEANPNYSPEATSRDCVNWLNGRQAALERDGFRCVQCGREDRLHVHHKDDPDCHEADNLVTLCASCHRKEHPLPHGPDGKFQSIR
jgi:hypothetical protein